MSYELRDQIEQLKAQVEEQQELIKQYRDDEDETGADHAKNIKTCMREIARLRRSIDALNQQIEENNNADR